MRLVNTTSFRIEEFFGNDIPRYAILSHTWGRQEVSYHEWVYAQNQCPPDWRRTQTPKAIEELKSRDGYRKIIGACREACKDDYDWIWVDTICIDKTSSVELSEAINSMYHWYYSSEICYAYLSDVPNLSEWDLYTGYSQFNKSRWFSRGWTLQELLAPRQVKFYSKEWLYLSDKKSLANEIQIITGIPSDIITSEEEPATFSIAEKMSWAAKRNTTRIEDIAYCLLGIFDVNMPLLYGEGKRAFQRFQDEIIRRSTDQSFLIWQRPLNNGLAGYSTVSLLAPSPASFCQNLTLTEARTVQYPFTFSNIGPHMRVPLVLTSLEGIVFAVLSCKEFSVECSPIWPYQPNKTEKLFWILLRHDSNGIYERVLFPVNYIKIVPLLPASWMYRLGRLTEAYPDAVDIIIRSNPTTVSGELERALQDEVLRLRWRVSPLPRTSVLLTFPSGLCGWKICSMFPDYRNTFLKAPNSCLNHIIWLENCVCSSGTDHCTVKFAHPYNDTITVRFVFIARLEGNRLWEPYACCDSTGTKGTVLDSGSKITLGKLQKWSIIDNDEYARVMISNPFPDFSIAGGSPLSRIRIFLAQILFKDTPGPWEGR